MVVFINRKFWSLRILYDKVETVSSFHFFYRGIDMFENRQKTINKVVEIPINNIIPNPAQPRRIFENGELESLSLSIRENGIIQPISVRKNMHGQFEIIAGERRIRAAKLAGLTNVPCIICDTTPKQSAIFAVLENVQRSDLSPIEEADALNQLIIEWNVTQEDAAARLGIAQSTFSNKLRLLKLFPETQNIVTQEKLNERQARALLRIKDKNKQVYIAKMIADKKLNVADTEKLIDKYLLTANKTTQSKKFIVKDVRLFINTINKAISTMKQAGIPAMSQKSENEEYIEYTVRIPIL